MNVLSDPIEATTTLMTKEKAGYTSRGYGMKLCLLCLYMIPRRACRVVEGLIDHQGTCSNFNPIETQRVPS